MDINSSCQAILTGNFFIQLSYYKFFFKLGTQHQLYVVKGNTSYKYSSTILIILLYTKTERQNVRENDCIHNSDIKENQIKRKNNCK